ncbi:C-24(28) sterol reductase [Microbotryomycetes sp. JL201]|nr:C-24(28) sterol reductase [Microbotryomycetes sp. JL201]
MPVTTRQRRTKDNDSAPATPNGKATSVPTSAVRRSTRSSSRARASAASSAAEHDDNEDSEVENVEKKSVSNASPRKRASATGADEDIDKHHEYEFNGPVGVTLMMTLFPALFYYLFVCLYFYDGKFATPSDIYTLTGKGGWVDFVKDIAGLVREHAAPTKRAAELYLSLIVIQTLLAFVAPGVKQEGLPVSSLGGRTLTYNCNAYSSLYVTLAIVGAAHYYGVFDLAEVINLFGPLMTMANIFGFALAAVTYVTGDGYRMSGNLIYDYFMGSTLNPRLGSVDIKMFAEIRQYEQYGYISPNLLLFSWGTFMYVNACAKGEQYIPQTWDMNFEKFGWLLSYWNFAGVPFSYAFGAVYMATHDPATYRYPTAVYVFLFVFLTVSHALFDVAMGQKSYFKAIETNTFIKRYTFPQIPGVEMKNPKYMVTERGSKLLIDGMWAYLRKPNYTFDWFQALVWGLSAGFGSAIPYFYPVFHLTMLLHRNGRDEARCARKYKKSWVEYKQRVPYLSVIEPRLLAFLVRSSTMATKTIILLGATGETGRQALAAALASPSISLVHSFGRSPPKTTTSSPDSVNKLVHTHLDFDKLLQGDTTEADKLKSVKADSVVIALGTTRAAAGSFEKFFLIDREYVLGAAKCARVQGKKQSVVYCSSGSASSSSPFPYIKSKGLTEEGLAAIGYDETIIFRPGMLVVPGGRAEHRLMESLAAKVTGVLARFTDSIEIKTPVLGQAMIKAAIEGVSGLSSAGLGKREQLKGHEVWSLNNSDAMKAGSSS